MIPCSECIQSLYPDDPRVPVGRYHQSTCDYYCDKPDYYRELEKLEVKEVETTVRHVTVYDIASNKKPKPKFD